MAIGTYGTIRPSDVSPQDVEIILNYTPSRDATDNFVLKKLDASNILRPYFNNNNTGGNADIEILGGLYNLKLPAEEFNKLGIYTLYIRPAQIRTQINDCGVLSALPNVKGIVINLDNVPIPILERSTLATSRNDLSLSTPIINLISVKFLTMRLNARLQSQRKFH